MAPCVCRHNSNYCIGGHGSFETRKDCYTLENCEWKKSASLKSVRRFASAVGLKNSGIYVIGGEDTGSALDTAEKLGDPEWSMALPQPISRHCAVQVDSSSVYVIGGRVGEDPFSRKTFRLDLSKNITLDQGEMREGKISTSIMVRTINLGHTS